MKNSSHPLMQALAKRTRVPEPSFDIPKPQRIFEIKKEDIASAKRFDPGDNAKFSIQGKVKSIHDDGSMLLHVHSVAHDPTESDAKPEPIRIETQESHAP